jgi:hypothetical protein
MHQRGHEHDKILIVFLVVLPHLWDSCSCSWSVLHVSRIFVSPALSYHLYVRNIVMIIRILAPHHFFLLCSILEIQAPEAPGPSLWSGGQSSWLQIGDVLCFL